MNIYIYTIYIYYIYMGLSFHKWGYNWLIAGISGLNCEWSIRNNRPDGLGGGVLTYSPRMQSGDAWGLWTYKKSEVGWPWKFFVCILQALPQNPQSLSNRFHQLSPWDWSANIWEWCMCKVRYLQHGRMNPLATRTYWVTRLFHLVGIGNRI